MTFKREAVEEREGLELEGFIFFLSTIWGRRFTIASKEVSSSGVERRE